MPNKPVNQAEPSRPWGTASDAKWILSNLLSTCPDVRHGFSTRVGGVSVGPLASLNLAQRPGETEGALLENWRRAVAAVGGAPDQLALLHQVHGAEVVLVGGEGNPIQPRGPLQVVASADGAVTTQPGVVLAVRTADCVPLLLWAPGGVAVAHAGWRGAAAGVVGVVVRRLCAETGAAPRELRVAIGPYISGRAYEVGEEVVEGLIAAGVPREIVVVGRSERGRPLVDVGAGVAFMLRDQGVNEVDHILRCSTGPELYSHRADGPHTGRMAGLIQRVS